MTSLTPRQAYRLWAPTYTGENAVCILENRLVSDLTPPLGTKRLLDAGCGVGLRLKGCGAELAIGVDASPEMLAAAKPALVAGADVRALPFPSAFFDIVWCRLMIGYLADLAPGYGELARVVRPGGHVLVSDFHADATAAGHRQTFRDQDGVLHDIAHHAHDAPAHLAAAESAGLSLVEKRDGAVGPAIRAFYEGAGRLEMYRRDEGLRIVAVFLFRKS